EDDVRRGRRRLFRVRVAMAGATTGALAVVLGVTSLTAGDPQATEQPPITEPPTTLPATPSSGPSPGSPADSESASEQKVTTGGNQNVDLAGDPSSQHTVGGEAPGKNATNGTATGGTTTHDGTS